MKSFYTFHETIQQHFGEDYLQLIYTDTDSKCSKF